MRFLNSLLFQLPSRYSIAPSRSNFWRRNNQRIIVVVRTDLEHCLSGFDRITLRLNAADAKRKENSKILAISPENTTSKSDMLPPC